MVDSIGERLQYLDISANYFTIGGIALLSDSIATHGRLRSVCSILHASLLICFGLIVLTVGPSQPCSSRLGLSQM